MLETKAQTETVCASEIDYKFIDQHFDSHSSATSCIHCYQFMQYAFRQELKGSRTLRFRNVPRIPYENTTFAVTFLLNSMSCRIESSDLASCRRVDGWDELTNPQDIVVKFHTQEMRDRIYHLRLYFQNYGYHDIQILDELIPERIVMWRRAVRFFGPTKVDTLDGAIRVRLGEHRQLMHTFEQLEAWIDLVVEVLWMSQRPKKSDFGKATNAVIEDPRKALSMPHQSKKNDFVLAMDPVTEVARKSFYIFQTSKKEDSVVADDSDASPRL